MPVIAGIITIDPAKRDVAIAAMREMMAATRQEQGCLNYCFSGDFDDPGTIRLFEEWESQDAINAHMKTPHMKAFQARIPELGFKGMKAFQYEVASKGPLGGGKR